MITLSLSLEIHTSCWFNMLFVCEVVLNKHNLFVENAVAECNLNEAQMEG